MGNVKTHVWDVNFHVVHAPESVLKRVRFHVEQHALCIVDPDARLTAAYLQRVDNMEIYKGGGIKYGKL